jgi:hypothetical protein
MLPRSANHGMGGAGENHFAAERPNSAAAAMLSDSELRATSSAAAVCCNGWFGAV